MELRIKPFPRNSYPKKGLLIKGSSPLLWLQEMEILEIELHEIQSFPIPSNEPNVLYGCFLIFKYSAPSEIGRNAYFQSVEDKLFIPENTIFYPKVNPEDWQNIDAEFIVMHPDFGLVKLNEEIDWISIIQDPKKSSEKVKKPSHGVKIPQTIKSFTVEISEEKILEALQKPEKEEEWMKNLPFNLKKVMAGNKKEFEKYLKYIEKYPDRALQLGVPLDIMGTSRGDGFGKFRFGNSWLSKIFGRNRDSSSGGKGGLDFNGKWIFFAVMIIIGIFRISVTYDNNSEKVNSQTTSSGKVNEGNRKLANTLSFESGITEIDLKIDSIYRKKRTKISNEYTNAVIPFASENSFEYKDYLEKGGKPLPEIAKEIDSLKKNIATSKDSLKRIYNKKIVKIISEGSENLRQKINDSIKKKGNGIPAENGVVEKVLNRKQILMADSLGKLFGTLEQPAKLDKTPEIMITGENQKMEEEKTSFSEIFWLVVIMVGAVGLFSFVFQKKKMNIGGENLPVGIKFFLMIVLGAMMVYLFYPLIEMFGYNWFVWILIICVVLLLYRLFREDKTILKSDDHE